MSWLNLIFLHFQSIENSTSQQHNTDHICQYGNGISRIWFSQLIRSQPLILILSPFHNFLLDTKDLVHSSSSDTFFKDSDVWILVVIVILDHFLFNRSDDFEDCKINDDKESHDNENVLSVGCDELNGRDKNDNVLVNTQKSVNCDENFFIVLNKKYSITWLNLSAILTEYSLANHAIRFLVN